MIITILFFLYVAVGVVVLLPIAITALILSFFGLRRQMSAVTYRVAQGWALLLIKMLGCPLTVTGRENIPKEGGVCFVSNHDGFLDTVLVLAYCGRPFGFVGKKELSYIPLFNMWIPLLGGLYIDRKNIRSAIKTINKGIAKIKAGGGMLIFPEGHRSKGRGLLPFHPGSLKLATQALAPIVPIAITGSYNVFEKNYRVKKSPVRISFCQPINTAEMNPQERKMLLPNKIFSIIDTELKSAH